MKILGINIETVRTTNLFLDLPENLRKIWHKRYINRKSNLTKESFEDPEINLAVKYADNAGFYPEFSQIVCISVSFYEKGAAYHSFICTEHDNYQEKEKMILTKLSNFLTENKITNLLGHNILGFDIPFLRNKYIKYRMQLPIILKASHTIENGVLSANKPWIVSDKYIDTMKLFKGTSFENYSIDAICSLYDIETPKAQMDDSEVYSYYQQGKINEISKCCEADVKAVKNIYYLLYNFLK